MTEEELKLVEENMDLPKLVCFSIRSWFRGDATLEDECESVAIEQLCRAATRYKASRGNFKTFACATMRFGIWTYLRSEYSHGMSGIGLLNAEELKKIIFCDDVSSLCIENTTDVIDSMLDVMQSTSIQEQNMLSLLLDGQSDRNISNILNISAKYRNEIKNNLKEKMQRAFFGDYEKVNSQKEAV